jgi:hypothetical protein
MAMMLSGCGAAPESDKKERASVEIPAGMETAVRRCRLLLVRGSLL